MAVIVASDVVLIAIPLPLPFRLGFGVLHDLPRVLLVLHVEREGFPPMRSVGEASIDFPFSHYDAWDIIVALRRLTLCGRRVDDRDALLDESWAARREDGCYAAHAALNMALDDAVGRVLGCSACALYGGRPGVGVILESIGIPEREEDLRVSLQRIYASGRIPKLKCDADRTRTLRLLAVASAMAKDAQRSFAVDFNGTLTVEQWDAMLRDPSIGSIASRWLFAEQPVGEDAAATWAAHRVSMERIGVPVVADEGFLTEDDARFLGGHGVYLNMKIQKLGGIREAVRLERVAASIERSRCVTSLVGGTFPTALGRAYDRVAASVLASASLPSDGWQPASDWFWGERHFIAEQFLVLPDGRAAAFSGPGLGCTPNWEKIQACTVEEPEREYAKIRATGRGDRLRSQPEGVSYGDLYRMTTGRDPAWNIELEET